MPIVQQAKDWIIKRLGLSQVSARGGWWPIVRESFAGAWQQNLEITLVDVLSHPIVFACITLIASDVAKMGIRLVKLDDDGIWEETESPSFSPILREPNHFQTRIQFYEHWMISKLAHGNTYTLKVRDNRQIVTRMYVLDPTCITPLVAPDGSVYYQIKRDDLSGVPMDVTVPASEIIHDRFNTLYHPLVGLSPIYACGLSAIIGLKMLQNSANLFTNGSMPGGILLVPGAISQQTADELKATWASGYSGNNYGKVAVLGDNMRFEPMKMQSSVESQLKEQLDWISLAICSAFHVPAFMVGVGPYPSWNNVQSLTQIYYGQCLQVHIEHLELCLDKGLGLSPDKIDGVRLGTELDLDNLLRMDTATMMSSLKEGVLSGLITPNEGRKKLGYAPVEGGDTPYMQQQQFSLAALNKRDEMADPFASPSKPAPEATAPAPAAPAGDGAAKFMAALLKKIAAFDHAA